MRQGLLLLLAAGVLLWLWAPWDGADDPAPDAGDDAHGEEQAPTLRGTAGDEGGHASPGEAERPTRPPSADAPPGAAPADAPPLGPGERRVVIDLLGHDESIPGEYTVRLMVASPRRRHGRTSTHTGRGPRLAFVPTARWMRAASRYPIQATVEHPAYQPATVLLPVPSESTGDLTGRVRLVRTYAIRVDVRPAIAWRDHEASCALTLFPLDDQGAAVEDPERPYGRRFVDDAYNPGPGGRYLLRAPAPGRYVIFITSRGSLPAFRTVTIEPDAWETELPKVALEAARTLKGSVRVGGVPVEGARLEILPGADGQRLSTSQAQVVWLGDAVRPGRTQAVTEADGTFEFETLPAGPLFVEIIETVDAYDRHGKGHLVVPSLYEDQEHVVAAGTTRLDIDIPAAWLDVEVVNPDGHPAWGLFHVTPMDIDKLTGDPQPNSVHEGHVHVAGHSKREAVPVAVPAGEPLVVSAEADMLVPALVGVDPVAAGTRRAVRLKLEADGALGTVKVIVSAEDGEAIPAVSVRIEREDIDDSVTTIDSYPASTYRAAVMPGTWKITVAGPVRTSGSARFLLPASTTLVVSSGEETEARLELARGGLLKLAARTKDGRHVPAACRILDPGGVEHERRWTHVGSKGHMLNGRTLGDESASITTRPLAPDTYTLVLSREGFVDARATVTIDSGKTAVVDVTMEAK